MSHKRESEAIWIEKQSRWICKVTMEGKRKSFYSSTPGRKGKREAERKADDWLLNGFADDAMKFGVLWSQYIAHECEVRGEKSSTYIQHRDYGKRYILPLLEYRKLSSIKPIDWQNCIDITFANSVKRGKPLSRKTLTNIRGTLSSLKTYCASRDIDLRSMHPITIPDAAPVGERTILQPADLAKLFSDDVPQMQYLNAWRFEVVTGLRPGEICALQKSDITKDGMITIRSSYNVERDITHGKNRNAKRTFLLPAIALKVLDLQAAFLKQKGIISPYIFPDANGDIAYSQYVRRRWHYFTEKVGMTRCTLYELRHTFVSMSTDVPDALLKAMVGHARNFDTRGIYGHEVQGNRQRTASLVDGAFERAIEPTNEPI